MDDWRFNLWETKMMNKNDLDKRLEKIEKRLDKLEETKIAQQAEWSRLWKERAKKGDDLW